LEAFVSETETNGAQGTPLGNGLFKARLEVKSKGKGKSGGMRIISYQDIILASENSTVYLVSIYDKSEASTVEIKQIIRFLKITDCNIPLVKYPKPGSVYSGPGFWHYFNSSMVRL